MAKKERPPEPAAPTRKQSFVSKRQRTAQRLVLIFAGVVTLAVVLVLAYGLVRNGILNPGQPVAVVSDEVISAEDYRKRVRLRYFLAMQQNVQAEQVGGQEQEAVDVQSLVKETLDIMINEVLLRQVAADMGITVSEAEIDDMIRQTFGFPTFGELERVTTPFPTPVPATPTATSTFVYIPTPTPTVEGATAEPTSVPTATSVPTPTPVEAPEGAGQADASPTPTATRRSPTEEEEALFQEVYEESIAQWTEASGMTEAEIRELFEFEVIVAKVYDVVSADVPPTTEQALVSHILVETAEEGEAALARLAAGESFPELAAEISLDATTAYRGGEIGWVSRDQLVSVSPELADLVFSQPVGEPGGPVQTLQGFHVVLVRDRQEALLSEVAYYYKQQEEFQFYLMRLRADNEENIEVDEDWERFVPVLD